MRNTIQECYKVICDRWGIEFGDLDRDSMVRIIGISIGLGDLFNDQIKAELLWLKTEKERLDHLTPIEYMKRHGIVGVHRVENLLNDARGL